MITVGIDSYISLIDARQYCTDNDLDLLPTDDAEAEKLLKRASKALDRIYGNRYLGYSSTTTQTLYWPRVFATAQPHAEGETWFYVVDSDGNPRDLSGIPRELGWATTELSLMLQNGDNVYEQPYPELKEEKNKIDTLESHKVYNLPNGYSEDPMYSIKLILRPLLKTTSTGVTMTRGK